MTSTPSRPPLARKHTPRTKKKADDAMNVGLTISVDGVEYTVRQGDMSSMDTMALRRETGFSFMGLLRAFQSDPDIDLVAALVWLARRIDGEALLSYADVASEIGYDVDLDVLGEAGEESDPEA